jgi:hypothetical protein
VLVIARANAAAIQTREGADAALEYSAKRNQPAIWFDLNRS